jgi:hypothetical protein
MKNQYFGDINDYRKYGLLRILMDETGLKTAICWMLTPDDGGTDGRFTDYLLKGGQWRRYDPELFDALRRAVVRRGVRSVRSAERSGILAGASFHSGIVPRDCRARAAYFKRLALKTQSHDLIFFDPDNGMEVASAPPGSMPAPKYLYWSEVRDVYEKGRSLLVYQHFPRKPRRKFIADTANRFRAQLGAARAISFETARIAFFLIPQKRHRVRLEAAALKTGRIWTGQIAVQCH